MRLTKFSGMFPKASPFARDAAVADYASNMDPTTGTLRSFRAPLKRASIGREDRIDLLGCEVITLPTGADSSAVYSTSTREIVYVLDGKLMLGYISRGKVVDSRPLSVTPPAAPPVLIAKDSSDKDARWRSYSYTIVSPIGEESSPSPASLQSLVLDGESVTLSFPTAAPLGYSIRVYRSATATRSPDEALGLRTGMLLVAEIPGNVKMYEDKVKDSMLGRGLDTVGEGEAPSCVTNIIKVAEHIPVLAASFGHQLMFSKAHRPNAWDFREELSLRGNIISMRTSGEKLIVVTAVGTYMIDALPNDGYRGVVHLSTAPPPLSNSKDAIVATPMGVVYPATEGLYLVAQSGEVVNITANVASALDFRRMFHGVQALGYSKGVLYISTEDLAYAIPLGQGTDALMVQGIIEVDKNVARQYLTTNTGQLYAVSGEDVNQWDAGEYLTAVWEATVNDYVGALTAVRGLLDTGTKATVTLTALGSKDTVTKEVLNAPVRLRPLQRSDRMTIRIEVTGELMALALASKISDLNR